MQRLHPIKLAATRTPMMPKTTPNLRLESAARLTTISVVYFSERASIATAAPGTIWAVALAQPVVQGRQPSAPETNSVNRGRRTPAVIHCFAKTLRSRVNRSRVIMEGKHFKPRQCYGLSFLLVSAALISVPAIAMDGFGSKSEGNELLSYGPAPPHDTTRRAGEAQERQSGEAENRRTGESEQRRSGESEERRAGEAEERRTGESQERQRR